MILAHGSGIDELLMFVVPVVVAMFIMRAAERRAKSRLAAEEPGHPDPQSAP